MRLLCGPFPPEKTDQKIFGAMPCPNVFSSFMVVNQHFVAQGMDSKDIDNFMVSVGTVYQSSVMVLPDTVRVPRSHLLNTRLLLFPVKPPFCIAVVYACGKPVGRQ